MKITMLQTMAGPQGVARRGRVIDVDDKFGAELLAGHYARKFDKDKDDRRPRGMEVSKQRDDE